MPRKKVLEMPPVEGSEEADLPRGKVKDEEFFDSLQDRWTDGCVLYVYRLWPVIDRKLVDAAAYLYIDKVAHPITREWLLKQWGSGEYKVRLNDENRPRGQNEVCYTTINLKDPEIPPVLDPRELVIGHKDNRGYVEALRQRGLLKGEGGMADDAVKVLGELARDGVTARANNPEAAVQSKALDMLQDAHRKSLEIVTATAKPVDPLELAARMKELLGGGESMALLFKMLMEQSQANQALMLKLLDSKQASAAAPAEDAMLERMERWMGLFSKLGFKRGGGESSGFSFESVLNALPSVSRLLELFVASRLAQQQVPSPSIIPAGVPAVVPHGGAAAVSSAPPPSSFEVPMQQQQQFNPALVDQIADRVADAMRRGRSGDEFADGLVSMLGDEAYEGIAALGPAGILAVLQSAPAAWARLSVFGEEKLAQFVGEFVAYGQADDDDGEERRAA